MQASKKPEISMNFRLFYTFAVPKCKKKDLASTKPQNTKRKNLDFSRLFTGAPRGIRTHK